VPTHGPLVKRTVTVTKTGGEVTQTSQQAVTQGTAASETKAAAKGDVKTAKASESSPSAGCIGASWLWGAAVLVGVVGVLYFAVKFRKAV
jgi:cobalamin biosynthesis Mg chelatase CobN